MKPQIQGRVQKKPSNRERQRQFVAMRDGLQNANNVILAFATGIELIKSDLEGSKQGKELADLADRVLKAVGAKKDEPIVEEKIEEKPVENKIPDRAKFTFKKG